MTDKIPWIKKSEFITLHDSGPPDFYDSVSPDLIDTSRTRTVIFHFAGTSFSVSGITWNKIERIQIALRESRNIIIDFGDNRRVTILTGYVCYVEEILDDR